MNTRLPKWMTLASSAAVFLALGAFAAGCSGADPASSNEAPRPAPTMSEGVRTQSVPTQTECFDNYDTCELEGTAEATCACELQICLGKPASPSCFHHILQPM